MAMPCTARGTHGTGEPGAEAETRHDEHGFRRCAAIAAHGARSRARAYTARLRHVAHADVSRALALMQGKSGHGVCTRAGAGRDADLWPAVFNRSI